MTRPASPFNSGRSQLSLAILALPLLLPAALAGCDGAVVQLRGTTPIPVRAARPPEPVVEKPAPKPPTVVLTETQVQINEKVLFATGKADILPESNGLLDEVATVIKKHPRLKRIEVAGHTDAQGSVPFNDKLSANRARSVWAYMVKSGVDPARLVHKGYGKSRPVADNTTPEGREKNRRVEFNILEQDPPPAR
jgi:OOP family OmpA-OmpF porin